MMLTQLHRILIDRSAQHRALPPWNINGDRFSPGVLLEGLVLSESGGRADAVRYEAHQDKAGRTDAPNDPDVAGVDDGFLEDDKSYGLCQVMGYNIRALLFLPPLKIDYRFAFEPAVNLALGVSVLKAELKAVGNSVPRALARYNGGPSGDDGYPAMRLQAYVDRVQKHCRLVVQDRAAVGYSDRSMGRRWDDQQR